jgi:murein DD-endopeptidase MepM/ murein hydrolase activator NlpD
MLSPHDNQTAKAVSTRMRMPAIIDGGISGECYADVVMVSNRNKPFAVANRLMWRRPPFGRLRAGSRLSRQGAARRPYRRVALVLSICTIFSCTALPASAASWTATAQPAPLVNGGPVLFQVKAPAPLESLTGTWLGHQVPFSFDRATKAWFALAGVSLETAPGVYSLDLTGERSATQAATPKVSFSRKFTVTRAKYPKTEVKLTVQGKFTEPSPEQLKQVEEAKAVKQNYLNRVTADREWSGKFAAPAEAAISDVFNSQRVFNGKTLSSHLGLDFRVPSGTPVAAMNGGTVLLARFLYYEGNFVVIDHGQGLLTLYLHLSEFKVKEGDTVKRGQEIGLSGGTGRATGPHLHVAVRWQGTYLDPARLLQLPLP